MGSNLMGIYGTKATIRKALAVVAHPDDCIIFAKPFIEKYFFCNWKIVYLTYNKDDPRAIEIANYWKSGFGVKTAFLGFEDNAKDLETDNLNFWTFYDAEKKLVEEVISFEPDIILTHNKEGEYGHIHHKIAHLAMNSVRTPKIYFSFNNSEFNKTHKAKKKVDLEVLPLHKSVIEGFDTTQAKYLITPEAKYFIK